MPGKYAKTYNTDTNKFEANPNYGKSTPASNTKQKMAASGGNSNAVYAPAASLGSGHSNAPTFTQKVTPAPGKAAKAPTPMPRSAGAAARSKTAAPTPGQSVNLYEGFQVHRDTNTFAFPPKSQSRNPANTIGAPKSTKPKPAYTKGGNAGDKTKVNALLNQGQGQFGPGSVFTNPTSNKVPFLKSALDRKYPKQ